MEKGMPSTTVDVGIRPRRLETLIAVRASLNSNGERC